MVGPSLGGWLYEIGGIRAAVPVRGRARRSSARSAFLWLDAAAGTQRTASGADLRRSLRSPAVAVCAAAVVVVVGDDRDARAGAAAVSVSRRSGIGPARIGLMFGIARRRLDGAASGLRAAGRSLGRPAPDADRPRC